MASLNKATLIGNLGRDAELRYTGGGQAVASFSLATNENFKNKSGEWEKRTEWHRIVTWARLAEFCGEHLTKGKQVYVEGRIQTREWEDREGNKRTTTEINAQRVLLLGSRGDAGDRDLGDRDPGDRDAGDRDEGEPRPAAAAPPTPLPGDDDIPF